MRLSISVAGTTLLSCLTSVDATCTPPTGLDRIGDLDSPPLKAIESLLNDPDPETRLPYLFVPLVPGLIAQVVMNETPIQFRLAQIHGSTCYNAAAKFHEVALDFWGRDEFRICQPSTPEEERYFRLHEEITLMYAFYYSGLAITPLAEEALKPIIESFGLPVAYLDEPANTSTPWGIAKYVTDEMRPYVANDGWNADGKLANEFNALKYSDFSLTGSNGVTYEPYQVAQMKTSGASYASSNGGNWPWQPLIESDGRGYFTKQEHVTPFAGFTGRLYGMDRSYYESFTAEEPSYDYTSEALSAVKRTKTMATSDDQKMLMEYFDSKFTSILPLQIQWSIKSGKTLFEFWYFDMILVNTMYDATLLVWKEKIRHNAIRPTNVVHELLGDKVKAAYAGPYEGAQRIPLRDWQPYVRTMPHAEYPSGSACICTAFKETMVQLSGADDFGFTVTQTIDAGSSRTEPGVTPQTDLDFVFNSWSDIETECSQSRLYGGMHFTKAVTAGNELCSGFITPVVDHAELLLAGNSDGALGSWEESDDIEVSPKGKVSGMKSGNLRNEPKK